jgi:tetratricopeptide (TPR) repeat protein
MGAVVSLYFMVKLIKEYPFYKWKTVLWITVGIAWAISIRIGGLLFIAYMFFFIGLYHLLYFKPTHVFQQQSLQVMRKTTLFLVLAAVAAYFGGMFTWPYGLVDPLHHPLESLQEMTNIGATLRQWFEGELYWSDVLPWYYIPKYIIITIPLVVMLGLVVHTFLLRASVTQYKGMDIFILLFSFIFPVFYVIYKQSNVYGGWRHLNFVYPALIIFAAAGFELIFRKLDLHNFRLAAYGLCIVFCLPPTLHIIRNYPNHYIYFNELVGGVNGAYGEYELDYYFHSFKSAATWLKKNELNENRHVNGKTKVVANAGINFHFDDMKDKVDVDYVNYYLRGEKDWDYAIFANTFINSYQLKRKIWPPKGTIKTIDVNGIPVCAIVKRHDRNDYYGAAAKKAGQLHRAVEYFKKAIAADPNNDYAYYQLTETYVRLMQYQDAIRTGMEALKVYPDYDMILELVGIAYTNINLYDEAIVVFRKLVKVNKNYHTAYYNLGFIYANRNELEKSFDMLQQCIEIRPDYKPAYLLIAQLFELSGDAETARQYREFAQTLP